MDSTHHKVIPSSYKSCKHVITYTIEKWHIHIFYITFLNIINNIPE